MKRRSRSKGTAKITVLLAVASGCIGSLDLDGKACPCTTGYVCDTPRDRCVLIGTPLGDGEAPDQSLPDEGTPETSPRDASMHDGPTNGSDGPVGDADATTRHESGPHDAKEELCTGSECPMCAAGGTCSDNAQCCPLQPFCNEKNACSTSCQAEGASCASALCCVGLYCAASSCTACVNPGGGGTGSPCIDASDCCSGACNLERCECR